MLKKYTLTCFNNFSCTADKCSDNCCIGWDVELDKKTLDFYSFFPSPLKQNIDFKNSKVKMRKDGRCPFLNKDNLCDIIINYGYENISYICKNHPKFFNEFNTHIEFGYGLCCEEAVRLLFKNDVSLEVSESDNGYFKLRDKLFEIIKDVSLDLREKCANYLDLICEAEDYLFFNGDKSISSFLDNFTPSKNKFKKRDIKSFLEIIRETEPINDLWINAINKVIKNHKEISENTKKIIDLNKKRYEKLLYYYTFRYLLKDSKNPEIIEKGKFIITLVLLNVFFDTLTFLENKNDFSKNTVLISKQLEYSPYNLSFMYDKTNSEELGYEEIINYI